jgi:hypothetical protein
MEAAILLAVAACLYTGVLGVPRPADDGPAGAGRGMPDIRVGGIAP